MMNSQYLQTETTKELLKISESVTIRPPSAYNGYRWIAEDAFSKKRFSLKEQVAYMLLYCAEPRSFDDFRKESEEMFCLSTSQAKRIIEILSERDLLISNLTTERETFNKIYSDWSKKNWIATSEYHLTTWDYSFMSLDKKGTEFHNEKMKEYSQDQVDNNRFKMYASALCRSSLPKPDEDLLRMSIAELVGKNIVNKSQVSREDLFTIMSVVFGSHSTMKVPWNGESLLRKTSPSGGSRHPSEGYVVNLDVQDLSPGWYHINSVDGEAELLIHEKASREELLKHFPTGYGRVPFKPSAIIVITSVFDRNMYRYREPRTFRTLHLDVGHLVGTVELCAQALGLKTFPHYAVNETSVEEKLGLNGLEEGVMMSVTLGV